MRKIIFAVLVALMLPICAMAQKTLNVFLLGPGLVGGELLDQIERNHDYFIDQYDIDISVVGIANSRTMNINFEGIPLKEWRSQLEQGDQMVWEDYLDQVCHSPLTDVVFVDCSSNQTVADAYAKILKSEVSIATPNKKANSGPYEYYAKLKELSAEKTKFYYDANVGAALPILSSVDTIMKSGDQVVRVEAILSGTLSYLFNSFKEGTQFSDIVREAQAKGYTEPDPRDDLNGMDFARKVLILARDAGYEMEMDDIKLKRFLPDDCFEAASVAEFYEKLGSYDEAFTEMRTWAEERGKKLRYIATFENGKAEISLSTICAEHPFYHLQGTENMIAIKTNYYAKNPLIIRGQGAGAELTASKVLENIIRIGLE